jgi:hypothetical protein
VALETGLAAGVAMALLLPPVAARLAGTGRDLSRLLLPLAGMDRFAQTAEAERSSAVPALLGRLLEEVLEAAGGDLPRDLKQAGLARERLEELAGSVAGKTPDTAAGALAVLEAAWAGKRTA